MKGREQLVAFLKAYSKLENFPEHELLSAETPEPIESLIRKKLINETEVLATLAKKLGLLVVNLEDPSLTERLSLGMAVETFNADFLWENKIAPLWSDDDSLTLAMANPFNMEVLQTIQFMLSKTVTPVLASERQIVNYLGQYYPNSKLRLEQQGDGTNAPNVEVVQQLHPSPESEGNDPSAAPIVALVNHIISDAVKRNASDIHLQPMQNGMDVRFRIDGEMRQYSEVPKRLQNFVTSRFKLLAGMDIAEHKKTQDGRFRVRISGKVIDLRSSCIPTAYGETVVMRLLHSNREALGFKDLGIDSSVEQQLRHTLALDCKMVLVTGPTGSGKTTTLYTCLHHLRDGSSNILTVEDPIEYRIAGINQVQVNEAKDVTFATALRSMLRQDPDVIMVGEIRDQETAEIAVEAALTGHKVLSTLHTNDAPSAITRLLHFGIQPYSLASALGGIMAQRLVRRLCSECSGSGCEHCERTKYRGRIGLYSFLTISEEVAHLIAKNASVHDIETAARKSGYCGLSDCARHLVDQGLTSREEVAPYLALDEGSAIQRSSAPRQVNPATLSRKRILLIEDDADVRVVLAMVLQREMFEVTEAENGHDALEKLYQGAVVPDIILCDLMMPKMDGREFMSRMRADEQAKKIPVIILTAADSEENEMNLLDLGARDFVSKASSSNVMLARVRKALGS